MRQGRSIRSGALVRLALALMASIAAIALARWWFVPLPVYSEEYRIFGTLVRVDVRSRNEAVATVALADIGTLLAHNHRSWHAWESDSDLGRLNALLAQGESGKAPADLAEMIRYAQEGYRLSDGLFNAAMGKLIGAWGFHDGTYPLQTLAPTADELTMHLQRMPTMADVRIDEDDNVSSISPHVALDLNGLAEGYAARQVAGLLKSRGLEHALIYIGGDIMALGKAGKRPWLVGVRAPGGGLLGQVALQDGEVLSSSGDYRRYRQTDDGREGHIVDPRRGRPQRGTAAVSVLSDDPVMADIAATALTVAGPADFERIAQRLGMGCALLITRDGMVYMTPAMHSRLEPAQPIAVVQLTGSRESSCHRSPSDTVSSSAGGDSGPLVSLMLN